MRQVLQSIGNGRMTVAELPVPIVAPDGLLVANVVSLVSAGTERYVTELAKKNLLHKALERPDHVRRVIAKVREEGLASTLQQVRAKLDEPMPLGYSSAGIVIETGRNVQEFRPGDRVATAGPHAGVVAVGRHLCARIPSRVDFAEAAYAPVAAIALEGVRLARLTLGERALVIGLGLLGQIAVALLKAQGCDVFGIDPDPRKVDLAKQMGADVASTEGGPTELAAFTGGEGVDAVLITAATTSNQPIECAADACRRRGRIVLVGVAGLALPRAPFFAKELEFTVSGSLGPGRGDAAYEERGTDYPFGLVRWTAQRNMAAALRLMEQGKLPVSRLTTHRFEIDEAGKAYAVLSSREHRVGILLEYPQHRPVERRVTLRAPRPLDGHVGISFAGAGNFARLILLPLVTHMDGVMLRGSCSARGVNAVTSGTQHGFAFGTTEFDELLADKESSAIVIATRHDLHAELVTRSLRAGKNVFVEKPLCISPVELREITACIDDLGSRCPLLMVGFNRRFAAATSDLRAHFPDQIPLSIHYRFATPDLAPDHWVHEPEIGGGRLVGEACHAVDLAVAIARSPIVSVFCESAAPAGSARTTDDRVTIAARHESGSMSQISYQAGGDGAGPKERVEVFGDGRTGVIDEWARVQLWAGGRARTKRTRRDKGHRAELDAFVAACRAGGDWPIAWSEMRNVTEATFAAVESLRTGVPVDVTG